MVLGATCVTRNVSLNPYTALHGRVARSAFCGILLCSALTIPEACGEPPQLSEFERVSLLGSVWNLVNEHFYDENFNGVDWEATKRRYEPLAGNAKDFEQAARVINGMLDELETSHTAFYTCLDPEYFELLDVFRTGTVFRDRPADLSAEDGISYEGIGVYATEIEGEIFIKNVLHGGPGDTAGLKVGDRIISVDGQPWHPIRSFRSKDGQQVTVRVQRTPDDDSIQNVSVEVARAVPHRMFMDAMRESAQVIRRGNAAIGYIRVWSYAGEHYQDLLLKQLQDRLRDADALIVDLRDGWGGANPSYLNVFNQQVPVMTFHSRGAPARALDAQWRKPVVLLVNDGSRSGKEVLTYGFKKHGYGKVVGTRTAGAVTAGRMFRVTQYAVLYLAISDVRVDGERLEGKGVEPDVEVPFRLPYANGKDPQLDKALDVLVTVVKKPT